MRELGGGPEELGGGHMRELGGGHERARLVMKL